MPVPISLPLYQTLTHADFLPALGPGQPQRAVHAELKQLTESALFGGRPIRNRDAARCCLSALWLAYDFLDQSHSISQEIHTAEGSYWHGIMHRREPDYSNAKYWFRQVGNHSLFTPLAAAARRMAAETKGDELSAFLTEQAIWNPYNFIDLCAAIARGHSSAVQLAQQVAQQEWHLLFEFCWHQALGEAVPA